MPVFPIFPIPIYTDDVSDRFIYKKIQKELTSVVEKTEWEKLKDRPDTSHSLSPNAFASNILKEYNCKHFLKYLHESITSYLHTFGDKIPIEYLIDSSWLTKTTKGEHALQHTHGSADISGVYYLQTNGRDGSLFFQDAHSDKVGNIVMDLSCAVTNSDAPLKQGLLHMWPGFMGHGTRPNTTDDVRISLSFNLMFSRRGFTIKDNVDESERALVVRKKGWKDVKCY